MIKKKFGYFIFLCLTAFLAILPQLYVSYSIKQSKFLLLLFLLLVIFGLIGRVIFVISIFLLDITSIFIVHTYLHWGGYDGNIEPRLAVAYISPSYETFEYLQTYINIYDLSILIYLFISFVITLFIFRFHIKIPLVVKGIAIVLAILIIGKIKHREPVKIIDELINVIHRNQLTIDRVEQQEKQHDVSIADRTKKKVYDDIVIIFGESVNRGFLSLYGYHKETTPFMNAIRENLNYLNAIAPTNQTELSMPIYLVNARLDHFNKDYVYNPSLIKTYNDAGYRTLWLSNQGSAGKHDDKIRAIAQESNSTTFFNEGKEYYAAKTDNVFLNYFQTHPLSDIKSVYFLHLIGSHFDYKKRYTENIALNPNTKGIVEEYENSIYYTDQVLERIFKYFMVRNKKVLIIYLSDHGEVVSEQKHGHGFVPSYKNEYEVPFIIYSSIPNKRLQKIKDHYSNTPLNLENFKNYVEYLSYMRDDINISNRSNVISLTPDNVIDYTKLKRIGCDEKIY